MSLLNDCSSTLYATLPACINEFTVKMPSDLRYSIVNWFITDKFGHVYHGEANTDGDAVFTVSASAFPKGFFNPYIGQLIMEVKQGFGYCNPLEIDACGTGYEQVCIQFKEGNFSTQIPCEC